MTVIISQQRQAISILADELGPNFSFERTETPGLYDISRAKFIECFFSHMRYDHVGTVNVLTKYIACFESETAEYFDRWLTKLGYTIELV